MTLVGALNALFATTAELTAFTAGRHYPGVLPAKATRPALTSQANIQDRNPCHSGPAGVTEAAVEVTAHARTYTEAEKLAEAVAAALEANAPGMWGTTVIVGCDVEDVAPGEENLDTDGWQVTVSATVWYQEG